MQAHTGLTRQLQHGRQCDGFGTHRNGGQAQAGGHLAVVRHAVARQKTILRAQPDAEAKRSGILHGAHQNTGVGQRRIGLAKCDAAGIG